MKTSKKLCALLVLVLFALLPLVDAPSYTSSPVISWMIVRTLKAVGASCPANFVANADVTGLDQPVVRLPAPGDGVIMNCRRSAWKFNVTDIPDHVLSIDAVFLRFNVSDNTAQEWPVDFTSIETDIKTDTPPQLWEDIGNGSVYVDATDRFFYERTTPDVHLGNVAAQDLKAAVAGGADEWSVGIKYTVEARGGGIHDASVIDIGTPRISLIVSYTLIGEEGGIQPGVGPGPGTGSLIAAETENVFTLIGGFLRLNTPLYLFVPDYYDLGLGITTAILIGFVALALTKSQIKLTPGPSRTQFTRSSPSRISKPTEILLVGLVLLLVGGLVLVTVFL